MKVLWLLFTFLKYAFYLKVITAFIHSSKNFFFVCVRWKSGQNRWKKKSITKWALHTNVFFIFFTLSPDMKESTLKHLQEFLFYNYNETLWSSSCSVCRQFHQHFTKTFFYESASRSFSLVMFWLWNFWHKNIGILGARKMLMKLTLGGTGIDVITMFHYYCSIVTLFLSLPIIIRHPPVLVTQYRKC